MHYANGLFSKFKKWWGNNKLLIAIIIYGNLLSYPKIRLPLWFTIGFSLLVGGMFGWILSKLLGRYKRELKIGVLS